MSNYRYNGTLEIDGMDLDAVIHYTWASEEGTDHIEIEEVDVDCGLFQSTLKDEAMDQLHDSMVDNAKNYNWEDARNGI